MADIDAPSFSLGLDLEIDGGPDDIQELQVVDSDPGSMCDPPRVFKRLKRGASTETPVQKNKEAELVCLVEDDDIEEFSPKKDFFRDAWPSTQQGSVCGSSKVSLRGSGVLTTQESTQRKKKQKEPTLDASFSSHLEAGCRGLVFPKLTISPLRKFQLVDSDSDYEEPSALDGSREATIKTHASLKEQHSTENEQERKRKQKEVMSGASASSRMEAGCSGPVFPKLTISPIWRFQLIDSDSDYEQPSTQGESREETIKTHATSRERQSALNEKERKEMKEKRQSVDLWKDFSPVKSFRIPTPALDEVCEEYFQSIGNKRAANKLESDIHPSDSVGFHQRSDNSLSDPSPPAYNYFFHDDPRVQTLVRSRLPNFSPLGAVNGSGSQQLSGSSIDYMCQFKGETSKQVGSKTSTSSKASAGSRSRSKKSNAKEVSDASQGWMSPKIAASFPMDAGKRRVHASNSQVSGGRWYTTPEGKKVYVTRSGQELTGQIAYEHFRKENGGFAKSKKKAAAKKKE